MVIGYKTAKIIASLLVAFFLFAIFTSAVSARYVFPRQDILGQTEKATPSAKSKGKGLGRDNLENRLSEVKLAVCEKKQAAIQRRSSKLVARADIIQNRFDRIAQRVDAFYVDKLVPAGLDIENYDQILNNLENKRRDVAAAVGVAEDTANNFNCEGVEPKEQLKQFRTDMQGVIRALQAYKKAIVDYLVTVRTKAKNFKAETATSSAEPATPSAETE